MSEPDGWETQVIENHKARIAALDSERDALRAALAGLVERLDFVHEHPNYQSVWTLYHVHGGQYDGPKYEEHLIRARKALADRSAGPTDSERLNKVESLGLAYHRQVYEGVPCGFLVSDEGDVLSGTTDCGYEHATLRDAIDAQEEPVDE